MNRTLILVEPPAELPLTLEEIKAQARIDFGDEDQLALRYLRAATQWIDGAGGWLGRALMPQTWELRLTGWCAKVALPLPPALEIVSVQYLDEDGADQAVDAAHYRLLQGEPAVLWFRPSFDRPRLLNEPQNVMIRYRAGYQGDIGLSPPQHDAEAVPEPIRQALALLVAQWFKTRETIVIGQRGMKLPNTVDALLAPYRVWQ